MRFEFSTATRIVFGPGTVSEAGAIAKELGRRALVVTGRDPHRAATLSKHFNAHGISTWTLPSPGEPDLEIVQRGTNLARQESCDLVVSFGGGSALDAGKAIAAMLTNEGDLLDYLEVIGRGKPLLQRPAPFIAIPTTAGTGSEVTRNAVLASKQHRVKVSLRSPLMLPRAAIVDPELTRDLPPALTASTGLDALTQLIEPFVCARPNPATDALCLEGMSRAARSLRRAFKDGGNIASREEMSIASLFGGLALANAGLGAVHGFAGPIGGMFPAPHGAVCAALLPGVMEMNLKALRQRQPESEVLRRFDTVARQISGDSSATADQGVRWIRALVADLEIPPLRTYGLTQSDLPDVVEKSSHASSMKANPVVLTPAELTEIITQAL